jgi:phage baseplate assembly protein gpV
MNHHTTGTLSSRGPTTDTPTTDASNPTTANATFADKNLIGAAVLGQRLSVFWEGTDEGDVWYPGHVVEYNHSKQEYLVEYDDGDTDWYDLTKVKYKILPPIDTTTTPTSGAGENDPLAQQASSLQRRKTFSQLGLAGVQLLGERLEVFWSDPDSGDAWYGGVVKEFRISDDKHFIQFDDGDSDWYDLEDIKYRVPDNGSKATSVAPAASAASAASDVDHHHHTANVRQNAHRSLLR